MTTPIRTCSRCGCTADNLIEFHDNLLCPDCLDSMTERSAPIAAPASGIGTTATQRPHPFAPTAATAITLAVPAAAASSPSMSAGTPTTTTIPIAATAAPTSRTVPSTTTISSLAPFFTAPGPASLVWSWRSMARARTVRMPRRC